jgi:hypothetical protein
MNKEKAMDQQGERPAATTTENASTFSEAEYAENARKVVAHAAATGTAIVSTAEGTPRVVISIPTVDLPTLGD